MPFIAQLVPHLACTAFSTNNAITDQGLPPALVGVQADVDLVAGSDQARASSMRLTVQFDRLALVSGPGQPSASFEQKASHFFRNTSRPHLCHGLLLALQLLFESLDLRLFLGTEIFQLLLLLQGEHWVFVFILVGLSITFNLSWVQFSFLAVGVELGGFQPSGLKYCLEYVGSRPALRFFLGWPTPVDVLSFFLKDKSP